MSYVKVAGVSKHYNVGLKNMALSLGAVIAGIPSTVKSTTKVAVDNVSFEVNGGERLGIVGSNGAGKSTLLHIIAGLSEASAGSVEVQGHVNCIMTLGVGIREDLTGRQNIYVDGEAQGKSRQEIDRIADRIIKFAELGDFIDRPLRTYSSGMKARLAFSMITCIEPDILIIDEALGAGDAYFNQKASAKIKEICRSGSIVILVSHSMDAIGNMCERCIWMENGAVRMDGDSRTVTEAYQEHVRKADEKMLMDKFKRDFSQVSLLAGVELQDLCFTDAGGEKKHSFAVMSACVMCFRLKNSSSVKVDDIRIFIERSDGIVLIDRCASDDHFDIPQSGEVMTFRIPFSPLRWGATMYLARVEALYRKEGELTTAALASTVIEVYNVSYPHENPVVWWEEDWSIEELRD